MTTQVIMPLLGESVLEGTVSRWLKSIGDTVLENEPLLEINTDKVDSEIPSPASGTLLEIQVPAGTTVSVGTMLALIGDSSEVMAVGKETLAAKEAVEEKTIKEELKETAPINPPVPGREQGLGFISPVVARIAAEHNVDLKAVRGTGQGGRITKKDLLAYIEQIEKMAPPPVEAPTPEFEPKIASPGLPPAAEAVLPGEVIPLTSIRRAIADHMVLSKHTSPHVTTVMEADLQRVFAHRQVNKDAFARDGVNLTFTAYFVAATVIALKAYPIVNSSWSEQGIVLHKAINIGMATAMGEAGLIVPVIKNADGQSLLGLARTINDLAQRARSRQLLPEEVKGGTFTITNHGISGSLFATPIINQPQCAILGVGAIQKRVVVIDDAIAIRPMVYLSLTFDHRILDGASADGFLARVVESLQAWS